MEQIVRGDVFVVHLGSSVAHASEGDRDRVQPCVVVQNDVGNAHSKLTIVVPLRVPVPGKAFRLHVPVAKRPDLSLEHHNSMADCGEIHTVHQDRLRKKLGTVTQVELTNIDVALVISLGLDRALAPRSRAGAS